MVRTALQLRCLCVRYGFLRVQQRFSKQLQNLMTASSSLVPPDSVRGITKIGDEEKILFRKLFTVPCIRVPLKSLGRIIGAKVIRDCSLRNFSNMIKAVIDGDSTDEKSILLEPSKGSNAEVREEIIKTVKNLTGSEPIFDQHVVEIGYEQWSAKQCINAILPGSLEFGGFSQIGHIVHVNLREELLPYKAVIGSVLLDKIHGCRTVVNKLDRIEAEYRTFALDLLAGENEYVTEVRENGFKYQLDFSRVFWNSRLGTEHRRIVEKFGDDSLICDCCAGVGPFVLPASKRNVRRILANDLNPESIEWLKKNIALNKIPSERIVISCKDAKDFITEDVAAELLRFVKVESSDLKEHAKTLQNGQGCSSNTASQAHILMNLPAASLTFLPRFRGILRGKVNKSPVAMRLPFSVIVHCHLFVKATADVEDSWYRAEAERLVSVSLGVESLDLLEVHHVRKVAGRKEMYCVSFRLPDELMFNGAEARDQNFAAQNLEVNCRDLKRHFGPVIDSNNGEKYVKRMKSQEKSLSSPI